MRKLAVRERPVVMGFWVANSKISPTPLSSSHSPQTHSLRGATCTRTQKTHKKRGFQSHLHRECRLMLLLFFHRGFCHLRFRFFFFFFNSNASFKTLLLSRQSVSTLPVSDLVFISFCVSPSFSAPPSVI